jgi:amino acid transporter
LTGIVVAAEPEPARLRQSIGYPQLFTLGVGTIVGVAWLMVLGSVLADAGPIGGSVALGIGACAMLPIALCYAELAGVFPVVGGEIVYALEVFGTKTAFVAGMCLAFVYIINSVFFAVSAGWLVEKLIPGVGTHVLYSSLGDRVTATDVLVGVGGTLVIASANYRGARAATRLQDIATYGLFIGAAVFIVAGLSGGELRNLAPAFGANGAIGGVMSVLAITPYFFGGFNTIPQAMSELRASQRRKNRISGVLAACIVVSFAFYCLVLVAVSMVMPRQDVLAADLPIPSAFALGFHSQVLATIVLAAGTVGLIATWNAVFFAATRVLYVLGRSALAHPAFGKVTLKTGTPVYAILATTIVTLGGAFLGKGVLLPVVNVTSTVLAALYVIVCLGTWRYRALKPDAYRPYRVPGSLVIWFATAFSIYMVGLSLYQQHVGSRLEIPVEWVVLLSLAAIAWVFWRQSGALRQSMSEDQRRNAIVSAQSSV